MFRETNSPFSASERGLREVLERLDTSTADLLKKVLRVIFRIVEETEGERADQVIVALVGSALSKEDPSDVDVKVIAPDGRGRELRESLLAGLGKLREEGFVVEERRSWSNQAGGWIDTLVISGEGGKPIHFLPPQPGDMMGNQWRKVCEGNALVRRLFGFPYGCLVIKREELKDNC